MSAGPPAWLLDRIRAENPDGVDRRAQVSTCDTCTDVVLRGLDADRCAIAITVTPIELDHFGEYLALARGLRTYTLTRGYGTSGKPRWELDPRYRAHIENPHRTKAVVPEHRCGLWLPHWSGGLLAKMRKPVTLHDDGPPPF